MNTFSALKMSIFSFFLKLVGTKHFRKLKVNALVNDVKGLKTAQSLPISDVAYCPNWQNPLM